MPLRWGILSTANIAVQKVIPGMRADSASAAIEDAWAAYAQPPVWPASGCTTSGTVSRASPPPAV